MYVFTIYTYVNIHVYVYIYIYIEGLGLRVSREIREYVILYKLHPYIPYWPQVSYKPGCR